MMPQPSNASPASSRAIRIRMQAGTVARLSVYSVNGIVVQSKEAVVLIHRMSTDSIEFMSHLQFPVGPKVLLQFDIAFLDWQFRLIGRTDWQRREDNQYLYRCTLTPEPAIRQALVQALGDMMQRMNPEGAKVHFMYRMLAK
jgi:hypothetical protein